MGKCTVPKIFGIKKWFDKKFNDLCEQHDLLYSTRIWHDKVVTDFSLSLEFARRGYHALAFAAIAYTTLLGIPYWLFKKYVVPSKPYQGIKTMLVACKKMIEKRRYEK